MMVTHLVQEELSRRWKISPRTLERWRYTGEVDLPFLKIGGRVVYRMEDIERFELHNLRGSTAA